MVKLLLVVSALMILSGCSVQQQGISDSEVTDNVKKALTASNTVDPQQVDVHTDKGEVRLEGRVDSSETRNKIGDLVSVVKGVDGVDNNLEISTPAPSGTGAGPETTQPPSQQPVVRREPQQQPQPQAQQPRQQQQPGQQQQPQGQASEQQVRNALRNSDALSGVNMNVQSRDGTVILSGTVPNQASKELAERIARQQQGVTSVQNNLQVRQ